MGFEEDREDVDQWHLHTNSEVEQMGFEEDREDVDQ